MMSKSRLIIRRGIPGLLLGFSIGAVLAYADSPAPVLNGPQLVGTPVTSSGITDRLTLPTINVDQGETLITCTKAPSTVSVPVTDNHGNVWKEITPVATGSGNNIHVSMALTPSTGLTNVSINDGNCPQC